MTWCTAATGCASSIAPSADAYVSIFRVDTDGRVRLIFPRSPDEENYGYGGATYTVSGADNGTAFSVDDYAGVGYLFGIASTAPFNYRRHLQ